jgi:SAM-dependent methyltransferase
MERAYGCIRGTDFDCNLWGLIPTFHEAGVRRVLFPGSGIDMLPYLFEHQGFEVEAVDFSQVALDVSAEFPPTRAWWANWLSHSGLPGTQGILGNMKSDQRQRIIDENRQPGGRLMFRRADLFTMETPEPPFDAVVLRYVLEHFAFEHRRRLLVRMAKSLRPGGILAVHCEFADPDLPMPSMADGTVPERPFQIEEEIAEAGFECVWFSGGRWWYQPGDALPEIPAGTVNPAMEAVRHRYIAKACQGNNVAILVPY